MSVLPLFLMVAGATAVCLNGDYSPRYMNPASKQSLIDARFDFALDSLKKVALIDASDNIFFSPHSLHQALTLAYFGAGGRTEQSLKTALHIPSHVTKLEVQRFYGFENLIQDEREAQGNATGNYEYRSANRLWITDAKKLEECMLDVFGDQLQKTNFRANPEGVRNEINEWVSNTTKGHIRDLLPADAIDSSTDLVLANAVYFKGFWNSRFDVANSKRDLFYTSGSKNSVVTFMWQKKTFNHIVSEELGAHILELPYKGQEVSMFVLLPPFATTTSGNGRAADAEHDGVRQLIERINTEKGALELHELLDGDMPSREVEVLLPRFEIEKQLPIHTLLSALGAGDVVTPGAADFSGFLAPGEGTLHLGDAVHRAKIEVTEEGTTAVAATAIFSFRSSRPSEPAVFKANHPFLYFIYDKPTRSILFSGVYRGPDPNTS